MGASRPGAAGSAGMGPAALRAWPPTPFAAAVRLDGRWIPARPLVGGCAVVAAILFAAGTDTPVVAGRPVPILAVGILTVVVAIGLLDAAAGLVAAAAVGVSATILTVPPGDGAAVASLLTQVLVLASLGCLLAIAVTEVAREVWRIISARLPRLPRAVDAIGAGVVAVAVAWFSISGWVAASPVMFASAVPGATYGDLALPVGVTSAVTVAMATAGARAVVSRWRRTPVRVLPVATGWWAIGGQLAGGATLLLLLSSLFRDAPEQLWVAAGLVGFARLVRSGVAPEPRRLFGSRVADLLGRVPPLGQMLFVVVPSLGIATVAGDDVETVRLAFLVCLAQVLLVAERGPQPFPVAGDR